MWFPKVLWVSVGGKLVPTIVSDSNGAEIAEQIKLNLSKEKLFVF